MVRERFEFACGRGEGVLARDEIARSLGVAAIRG
jgi:hypothetical protein